MVITNDGARWAMGDGGDQGGGGVRQRRTLGLVDSINDHDLIADRCCRSIDRRNLS